MTKIPQLLSFMEKHETVLSRTDDPAVQPLLALLYDRLQNPRNYIVMAGETSSGKSTLINALCEQRVLPCSNKPTSGTVVHVEMKKDLGEIACYKYNRFKAEEEKISGKIFQEQAEHPANDVLRLKAEVPSPHPEFCGMNVFDTPGFASLVKSHEEVFRDFIPESDIVVFTTTYRNGVDQVSRDFLGLIGDLSRHYGELPVLLAVNRCPAGTTLRDKRVQEMVSAAEDAFHSKVSPVLINVVEVDDDFTGEKPLPDASSLWEAAAKLCKSADRSANTELRAKEFLGIIIRDQLLATDGKLLGMEVQSPEDIAILKDTLAEIETFKERASVKLEFYLGKLTREVPRLIDREISALMSRISAEIRQNNKYLNCQACSSYIAAHMAPFGIQQIAGHVNDFVADIMEQLDKELEEMANKTIATIRDQADKYEKPEFANLLLNLATRLGTKIAGETANGLLRGLGGVGGGAAGMGNLVKMAVSRLGHLFGKTFSREVYTQIGKIFTKKVMAALSVAVQVLIDTITFIIEANRWQGRLENEVEKMLDKWKADAKEEFLNSNIPAYRENNLKLFDEIQSAMADEVKASIQDAERTYNSEEVRQLRGQADALKRIQQELEAI